jgi:hypothetical protein
MQAPSEDRRDDVKDSFHDELGRVFDQFPKYDMKILLCDFNAQVGKEDILNPTIGNKSSHDINNDNRVRVVSFATSRKLLVKGTTFPYRDIHKYTWTSPEGKTHNQTGHILTDRRRYSIIPDARPFGRAGCDTDHNLVVAKVRERLAVSKRTAQKVDMERFNLKKLSEGEIKE